MYLDEPLLDPYGLPSGLVTARQGHPRAGWHKQLKRVHWSPWRIAARPSPGPAWLNWPWSSDGGCVWRSWSSRLREWQNGRPRSETRRVLNGH